MPLDNKLFSQSELLIISQSSQGKMQQGCGREGKDEPVYTGRKKKVSENYF